VDEGLRVIAWILCLAAGGGDECSVFLEGLVGKDAVLAGKGA